MKIINKKSVEIQKILSFKKLPCKIKLTIKTTNQKFWTHAKENKENINIQQVLHKHYFQTS